MVSSGTATRSEKHVHEFIAELTFKRMPLWNEDTADFKLQACACGATKVQGENWNCVISSYETAALNALTEKLKKKTGKKGINLFIIQ